MFLADYHIHSSCSFDAYNTMREMARAAFARGITNVLFTDHCDFDIPETLQFGPASYEVPDIQTEQFEDALRNAPPRMQIGLGLELGEGNHNPERALKIYAMPEYDFILGSLHNLKNMPDFYYLHYESEQQCFDYYDRYLDELIELAALPCFDVMAHIGYSRRYMHKQGLNAALSMERNGDKIDVLLRTLIENGRGIELNCADLVPGGRENPLLETFPSVPILRRYKELGGVIITVGSDSHTVNAAGIGVRAGYELLRENGFKYITLFNRHQPEFINI